MVESNIEALWAIILSEVFPDENPTLIYKDKNTSPTSSIYVKFDEGSIS